ncbi:hypothetical protein DFH09DRAFT_1433202 [Mycena vulgaris]|nr:hypothetical protein DFH09DRAFT_1433202 [Mycena vulgaris]
MQRRAHRLIKCQLSETRDSGLLGSCRRESIVDPAASSGRPHEASRSLAGCVLPRLSPAFLWKQVVVQGQGRQTSVALDHLVGVGGVSSILHVFMKQATSESKEAKAKSRIHRVGSPSAHLRITRFWLNQGLIVIACGMQAVHSAVPSLSLGRLILPCAFLPTTDAARETEYRATMAVTAVPCPLISDQDSGLARGRERQTPHRYTYAMPGEGGGAAAACPWLADVSFGWNGARMDYVTSYQRSSIVGSAGVTIRKNMGQYQSDGDIKIYAGFVSKESRAKRRNADRGVGGQPPERRRGGISIVEEKCGSRQWSPPERRIGSRFVLIQNVAVAHIYFNASGFYLCRAEQAEYIAIGRIRRADADLHSLFCQRQEVLRNTVDVGLLGVCLPPQTN